MREMFKAMKYMYGVGLSKSAALITDGRFSGTNNGCFVGHISPEAAEGGPLAIVHDGDEILIDVDEGVLELHVSDEEIAERYKTLKLPKKNIPNGYLRLYARWLPLPTRRYHQGVTQHPTDRKMPHRLLPGDGYVRRQCNVR